MRDSYCYCAGVLGALLGAVVRIIAFERRGMRHGDYTISVRE